MVSGVDGTFSYYGYGAQSHESAPTMTGEVYNGVIGKDEGATGTFPLLITA
jgi:hypothetical protein